MNRNFISLVIVLIFNVVTPSLLANTCADAFSENITLEASTLHPSADLAKLVKRLNQRGVAVVYNLERAKQYGGHALFHFVEKTLYVDTYTYENQDEGEVTPIMAHEARHALDLTSSKLKKLSPYRVFLKNDWGSAARYKNGFTIHEFLATAEELEVLFLRQDFLDLILANKSRPLLRGSLLSEFQSRMSKENLSPYKIIDKTIDESTGKTLDETLSGMWQILTDGTLSIEFVEFHIFILGQQVDVVRGTQVLSSFVDPILAGEIQRASGDSNQALRASALSKLIRLLNQRQKRVIEFRQENGIQFEPLARALKETNTKRLRRMKPEKLELLRQDLLKRVQDYKKFLESYL